ncbi:hypothetical protein Zm00014a_005333 [Zea mays]|uniref:Uncharacterized protein n=1 Tax=Zea mays TaxID=4577 RepID=A0A3L6FD67_MAIZE|nr:hypothetical protein Zm00014a_005333 [Zea mays]
MASADAAKPASPPAADPPVDDPMDADPAPPAGEEEQATPQKQQPEKKRGGRRKKGEAAEKTPPSSKKSAGPTVERPSRERKTVERYAELAPRATPAKKSPAILQGSGTKLKDIPNGKLRLFKRVPFFLSHWSDLSASLCHFIDVNGLYKIYIARSLSDNG